jgi:threonine/homoserine efflux transporter RhtA
MTQSPQVIAPVTPITRKKHRSRRRRQTLAAIGFVVLGLHWVAAAGLALWYYRPKGLQPADYVVVALAALLFLFYVWVAREVYRRRARSWSLAIGAAGIWVFGFPTGTLLALMLVASLVASRQDFSK